MTPLSPIPSPSASIPPEARLVLDPQFRLKNDVDRALLITRSKPLSDKDHIARLVHPVEAVILTLMDGERSLRQVAELWAALTGKPAERAVEDVQAVVDTYFGPGLGPNGILVDRAALGDRAPLQYRPEDFIIPADRVDLTDLRLRKPYVVYYMPTLYCTQKCVYCYAKLAPRVEPNPIPLARLVEIFAELVSIGVEVLQLTGGEPLARKDILQVIKAAIGAGLTVSLSTKLGPSYEQACALREIGMDSLQMSLDSSDPEILDRMVGVRSYHLRAFSVFDGLARAGMKVRVNTVLTPLNHRSVSRLIDYLGKLGNVVTVTLSPYGRSQFCHDDGLFMESADLDEAVALVRSAMTAYPHMRVNVGGLPAPPAEGEARVQQWRRRALCTANRQGFIILPDGRVTVCEELYDNPAFIIGDLRRQSVMEMWNSPEALGLLHPDQAAVPDGPCKTCSEFEACNYQPGRCWRDVLKAYGQDKPHYPDPRCPYAPAGARC